MGMALCSRHACFPSAPAAAFWQGGRKAAHQYTALSTFMLAQTHRACNAATSQNPILNAVVLLSTTCDAGRHHERRLLLGCCRLAACFPILLVLVFFVLLVAVVAASCCQAKGQQHQRELPQQTAPASNALRVWRKLRVTHALRVWRRQRVTHALRVEGGESNMH